jgi:hypothetical protein
MMMVKSSVYHAARLQFKITAVTRSLSYHNYPKDRSQDSVVGIATGYGLDNRRVGVRVPVGSRIFSSPRRPDLLLDPPNVLSNGYRRPFPGGKAAGA